MKATVREIVVTPTTSVDHYRGHDHSDRQLADIEELAASVTERLKTHRVWMLNSTEAGGGVAEMMPRLCSLLKSLGVDTRWLVLDPGDAEFFRVTKTLHNLLHGEAGPVDGEDARRVYERVSAEAAETLRTHVTSRDVLVVHDPQPLGAAAFLRPEHRPRLVWRCHIGLPYDNEHTAAGWAFLHEYLAPFNRMLFSDESYIPAAYSARGGVLYPSIDPLSHKNRELRPYKLIGVLQAAGLIEGPATPEWARFEAPAQRYESGDWAARPIEALLHNPVVLQVSRFDRLKGFQYLIPAFVRLLDGYRERVPHLRVDTERALSELDRVQLVLAGPDPRGVCDDPEGAQVLDELCRQFSALPPEVARRVHLLRLPMVNAKQNALMVNALQRIASVVVQNSLKEGFGLTASEALWKGAPVLASNVGGLAVQIRPGTDGLLVDQPTDPQAVADGLLELLAYSKRAEAMGRAGRVRVGNLFLVLTQVRAWLREFLNLLAPERRATGAGLALTPWAGP